MSNYPFTIKFIDGSTEGAEEYQDRIASLIGDAAAADELIGEDREDEVIRNYYDTREQRLAETKRLNEMSCWACGKHFDDWVEMPIFHERIGGRDAYFHSMDCWLAWHGLESYR